MEKYIVRTSKRKRIELEESEETSHVSKVPRKTDIIFENQGCDVSNPKNISTDEDYNNNIKSDLTKAKPPSDATLTRWKNKHAWLELNSNNRVICTICSKAVEKRLPISIGKNSQNSREAFVTVGYNCWRNAYKALRQHELSEFHRVCHQLLLSSEATSVVQQISGANEVEMLNNRTALHKIFSTVQMMGVQGLPFRGSGNDERSNLTQFLIYYEVFDTVVMSLKERFNTDTSEFLDNLEAFAIGRGGCVDEIMKFYQGDFDQETLVKHRDDFIHMAATSSILCNIRDVMTFMKENSWCIGLVPEYFRFIKLLLTIPSSTCTNERSFSALRRLKNYLRSTMLQERLNNIAILHVHREAAEECDLHEIMNEFITKNQKRSSKFAVLKTNKKIRIPM